MNTKPLVNGFRISGKMRPYVLRLRLRGRDFDFGSSPEAAVRFKKCIGDMEKILHSRRIAKGAVHCVIGETLEIAADFALEELRRAATNERTAAAQTALNRLIRRLRDLASVIAELPPSERGRLYQQVTAELNRSPFDTEVFIEVIGAISVALPTLSPRRRVDEALDIIHPNDGAGTIKWSDSDPPPMRRSSLIEYWETMPPITRANAERTLRDKPRPFNADWLRHVASLLDHERPRFRPPYSLMRKFAFPVAKIWRERGLTVGRAYKYNLHLAGRDGYRGGSVDSRFQRYCRAALTAVGLTDKVSSHLVQTSQNLPGSR
jgi:hypothetical protein